MVAGRSRYVHSVECDRRRGGVVWWRWGGGGRLCVAAVVGMHGGLTGGDVEYSDSRVWGGGRGGGEFHDTGGRESERERERERESGVCWHFFIVAAPWFYFRYRPSAAPTGSRKDNVCLALKMYVCLCFFCATVSSQVGPVCVCVSEFVCRTTGVNARERGGGGRGIFLLFVWGSYSCLTCVVVRSPPTPSTVA